MEQQGPTLETLCERIGKLERQNRAFKVYTFASLLVVCGLAVMGAAQATKTLTAEKLVITDASGKSRAVLAGTASGALLSFANSDGDLGASLTVEGKDSTLTLGGAIHKGPRLFLESDGSHASLRLTEPDGKAARLMLESNGPLLSLNDSGRGAQLSLMSEGPSLYLAGGKQGYTTVAVSESGPVVALGASENVRALLGVGEDGPSIELEDAEGYKATMGSTSLLTPQTGERHTTSAASLTLFGKEKNVIWKAP